MEQLENRRFAGIDIGKDSVQLSLYDEGDRSMVEESFPLGEGEASEQYLEAALDQMNKYMEINGLTWTDFQSVQFSMEDTSEEARKKLVSLLDDSFYERHEPYIITRFRAFVEYVFHQERAVWERNTILFDFTDHELHYILVEQIRGAKQKAYRAVRKKIDLEKFDIVEGMEDLDYHFSRLMKHFLVKNSAHIIYLTGNGFEGDWMKRTLTYLCAGRRVFLGQNLYANGACLLGLGNIPFMDEGMLLMQGPDMVYHTIGVITQDGGREKYVPITSIGREWYNTKGTLDIILDKSQKVGLFYHNTKENVIESTSCEIRDLPQRPPKTTRIRIQVQFTSAVEGIILLTDLGFGSMYPATGKVTVFPFQLIS